MSKKSDRLLYPAIVLILSLAGLWWAVSSTNACTLTLRNGSDTTKDLTDIVWSSIARGACLYDDLWMGLVFVVASFGAVTSGKQLLGNLIKYGGEQ